LQFQGVFSVLPTPFNDDGSLDLESLKKVVDLYLSAGINGVTALGVTGEVARLNDRERNVVLETVIKQVNGRGAVIAGTSADGLHKCIEYSREARAAGASGVMVSPPRMPKLNSEAIVSHFRQLAAAVDIPIVIQDFPPISGFTMEASLLVRIAREVPSARTIKLEDPPTPLKTTRILEQSKGMEVGILGGLGGVFLLEELLAGAAGVMTGFAYPEILVEVVRAFKAGDVDRASNAFYPFVSLMRFEFQEGIGMAIRKEVLRRRGAIKSSAIRAPGAVLDRATTEALDRQLRWIKANGGAAWISG
jgi:4-hydroxy-tetrahydrodipicolinate synthase